MSNEQTPRKRPRQKGAGSIFKPKGTRYWWIGYTSGGKRYVESTKSERRTDAQELLTSRLGDTQRGIVVTPKMGRKTIGAGLKAVVDNMRISGRRSVEGTQRNIDLHILLKPAIAGEPVRGYFNADRLMSTISTSDLTAYVVDRQAQGASAATCRNELAIIRRAFRLAVKGQELVGMPHIPMPSVNNARKGFFEREDFDAVLAHLPAHLHPPLKFAFLTGWRMTSEVLPLTTAQVDLQGDVVRLEPGSTKNDEGRSFSLTNELRKLLKAQIAEIEALKKRGIITPFVFHRPSGKEIKNFRTLWQSACEKAGCPGKLLHDFRRSAVRNLERAGVPRTVAMAMIGHKTESVYRRYAIVDEQMHREAAAKLDIWSVEQRAKARAARRGQLARFNKQKSA